MKILLDTNVIIDFLERRQPFFPLAFSVINKAKRQNHSLVMAANSVDNIVYILRKKIPYTDLIKGLTSFTRICKIAAVNQKIILNALDANWKDLEDAIQYHCALNNEVDLIVTRDKNGYEEQKIKIVSPAEALSYLKN